MVSTDMCIFSLFYREFEQCALEKLTTMAYEKYMVFPKILLCLVLLFSVGAQS